MNINWKVRFKNKYFWACLIPALIVLIKNILKLVGIDFDFTVIQERILDVIEAVFVVLSILGIVNDPTTDTISDSERAMTYQIPFGKN